MSRLHTLLPSLLLATALTGCPQGGEAAPPTEAPPGAAAAAIPDALYLAARPEGAAASLLELKGKSKVGDSVLFEARVGGREDPFVEGRAIFVVADSALQSCDAIEGDGCKTPWDYCCETPADLLENVATVRFVDAAGDPLEASVKDHKGLSGLKTVVVRGTVKEADGSGNFVVDADGVWIGR